VNGEANPEISITKVSTNNPLHNVYRSDGIGGNGCGTQLQAAINENRLINHQAIDNTGKEDNNEQVNDNRTDGKQSNQGPNNVNQLEQQTKPQDGGNTKLTGTGPFTPTDSEKEPRNPNTLQSKCQQPLITTPSEVSQQIRLAKIYIQQVLNESRSESQLRLSQPLRTPVGAEKKGRCSPVTEDKSDKRSKGYKTSVGSKQLKQRSNSENKIEMEPDSETDKPDQLDQSKNR
ncbi:MAG: hypothetical protein EZS28_026823, partial [Streblomastix strix]